MKKLVVGIVLIVLVGIGGLVYRNALEYPSASGMCQRDSFICPDGTAVLRTGDSCTFAACPPPNVSLPTIGISFAIPKGFFDSTLSAPENNFVYELSAGPVPASITIRRYAISASSTALATIQETAVNRVGLPVSTTAYSSTSIGTRRFTRVSIERLDGVVTTAYYLARSTDVLRFDATDGEVKNWSDQGLNTAQLPAHAALEKLLLTLQVQ